MGIVKTSVVVLCAIVVLATAGARASGGPGVYAIVERVSFEPSERAPERIMISGAFIVPQPMSSSQYLPAQRGYLYFKLAPGREETARIEWGDLKSIAGTGQAVGFANYWVPNPADLYGNPHYALEVHVHKAGAAATPDEYPLGIGVVKINDQSQPKVVLELRNALKGGV